MTDSDNSRLLDNEVDSDVEFIVGPEGDTWRIPAHREVLGAASPVFKAMLTGPLAAGSTVRIDDVDGRAFYHLIKVLYGGKPQIRSEQTCLQTMYVANKYLCTSLFLHCVECIDNCLLPENVLRVMACIKCFIPAGMDVNTDYGPSAPPLLDENGGPLHSPEFLPPPDIPTEVAAVMMRGDRMCKSAGSSPLRRSSKRVQTEPDSPVGGHMLFPDPAKEGNMSWYCGALYWNCLQYIDTFSDDVFDCESVEDLVYEDLLLVVRRSTLSVCREYNLFLALLRWADRDCKRRGVRVCADSKRKALGDTIYYVRYLRMTTDELLSGVVKSGVLDPQETACILSHALGNPVDPPESLKPYIKTFAEVRIDPKPSYYHLSARSKRGDYRTVEETTMTDLSCPPDMTEAEVKRQVKALKQIAKMHKKEEKRRKKLEEERLHMETHGTSKNSSNCFAETFFAILACIFD